MRGREPQRTWVALAVRRSLFSWRNWETEVPEDPGYLVESERAGLSREEGAPGRSSLLSLGIIFVDSITQLST